MKLGLIIGLLGYAGSQGGICHERYETFFRRLLVWNYWFRDCSECTLFLYFLIRALMDEEYSGQLISSKVDGILAMWISFAFMYSFVQGDV